MIVSSCEYASLQVMHMMLIMTELNETLEAETINPESEEKKRHITTP